MNLSLLLLGGRRLCTEAEARTAVMNLCLQNGYTYSDFCWHDDGSVSFSMPLGDARRLLRDCKQAALPIRAVGAYGFPAVVWHLRRRAGLLIGGALVAALLFLSGRFVWDVEVVGNESLSDTEVKEILRSCEFGVGSYIPGIKVRALENRVLISTDRIAWLSVYLDGTVARVQVVEREVPPVDEGVPPNTSKPANVIAACDGQIETVCIYRGEAVVTVGQAVKKGELLVSGIYSSDYGGFRYTRAAAEVWARTEHTYTVEIPLSYREKVYGEEKTQSLTLNFFNFPLKIFKSTGKTEGECDIIEKNIGLDTGGRELPFFFTRTYARTYTWQARTRTEDEALKLAYEELEETLTKAAADTQLLSRRITTELSGTSVKLVCTVTCIENIAVQSEFEIGD